MEKNRRDGKKRGRETNREASTGEKWWWLGWAWQQQKLELSMNLKHSQKKLVMDTESEEKVSDEDESLAWATTRVTETTKF